MPIISSIKSFGARRKSQGNIIDAGSSPAAQGTSFRVIPRNDENRKSVGAFVDSPYQSARQISYEDDSIGSSNRYALEPTTVQAWYKQKARALLTNKIRGSNSTTTSTQSRIFDTAPTGYSSTSTIQSPVEAVRKVIFTTPELHLHLLTDNPTGPLVVAPLFDFER